MEVFPFIFVFILASTYSVTRANFLSCNETGDEYYLECKPENSSVLVQVYRDRQKKKHMVGNTAKLVTPISLEFYHTGSSVCTTPEILTVSNDSFSDLPGVRSLHVECVQFQGFPTPFRNHNYLETLTFQYNEFTEFPQEFCANISSIKSITVNYQQIRELSKASFSSITKHLQNLDLGFIKLKNIKPKTFSRFRYLKNLRLAGNQLEILRPDMFDGLSHLETLDVGENSISTINPGTFSSLTGLRALFLHSNRLKNLPTRIFSDLVNLETLEIHNNTMSTDPSALLKGLEKLTHYSWGRNETFTVTKEKEKSFFMLILSYTPLGWLLNKLGK